MQIVFFVTTFFYNFGFDENFDLLKKPLIPAVNICYVKPLCNKSKRALDQLIFHQIGKHTLKHNNNNKFCIMVAPESTYPFCLNKHCDIVSFWSSALKKNDSFFVGSLFKNTDKSLHQAVFWIHNGKIVDWHTKKHYVPFVEIMPSFLQKVFVLKNMFLQNKQAFSYDYKNLKRTNIKNKEFDVCSELKIIPKLCSEFFFKSRISDFNSYRNINKSINRNRARKKDKKRDRKQVKVFFFINDSWFIDYFRKILKNSAYLMSAKIGLPVLYVGHFDCKEYSL